MRFVLFAVVLMASVTAQGADDKLVASGSLEGKKLVFPEKGLPDGARATVALLESCHSLDDGSVRSTFDDLKKAQEGDHVRLVFPKPISVSVLDDRFEVSELVFTQPSNTGVFWLRSGNKVRRASKFEFEKQKGFDAWRDQAKVAD